MKYYYVTYQKENRIYIYCANIARANGRETVVAHYEKKGYTIIDIHPATWAELLEGERKHTPFVDLS